MATAKAKTRSRLPLCYCLVLCFFDLIPQLRTPQPDRSSFPSGQSSVGKDEEHFLGMWKSNFLESLVALHARENNLKKPLATRLDGGTSIIYIPPPPDEGCGSTDRGKHSLHVVSWKSTEQKTGWVVDLDSEWLLIPVVHVGPKRFARDFSDAEVIVCQTGVTWTRAKRKGIHAEKNELPSQWKRIWQIWSAAVDVSNMQELSRIEPVDELEAAEINRCASLQCCVCGGSGNPKRASSSSSSSSSPSSPTTQQPTAMKCSFCMLESHCKCTHPLLAKSACVDDAVKEDSFEWSGGFQLPSVLTAETLVLVIVILCCVICLLL